jgi:NitT/TauT family transport system substrate-binding protein
MRTARIRLLWYPQPQFMGLIMAERLALGAARGVRIVTQPVDFNQGPVAAVLDGAADFAVASPSHILEGGAEGRLLNLLALQQESPLAYPVRAAPGAAHPARLAGLRAAVWPGGEDLEFRAMIRSAGGDPDALTYVRCADTVGAFLAGEADIAQTTTYAELSHVLEAAQQPVSVLRARDYGIDLVKDGFLAPVALCRDDPAFVQAVVDTVLEGWTRALAEPERAVALCCAARPDLDSAQQWRQFEAIRDLVLTGATRSHGLGYPDPEHDRRALAAWRLVHGDPVSGPLSDQRFWAAAPAGLRRTISP